MIDWFHRRLGQRATQPSQPSQPPQPEDERPVPPRDASFASAPASPLQSAPEQQSTAVSRLDPTAPDLEEIRLRAQQILADPATRARLAPLEATALEGLLVPTPTEAQLTLGRAALPKIDVVHAEHDTLNNETSNSGSAHIEVISLSQPGIAVRFDPTLDESPVVLSTNSVAMSDDAQAVAQWLLVNQYLVTQLPTEVVTALQGLCTPKQTFKQREQGLIALAVAQESFTLASLPLALQEWYRAPSWVASREWLAVHLRNLPADAADLVETSAARAERLGNSNLARLVNHHADLLREAQRLGVETAYKVIIGNRAFTGSDDSEDTHQEILTNLARAYQDELEAWVTAPTWEVSRVYLTLHTETLLTEEAEVALAVLAQMQNDEDVRQTITLHQDLLHMAHQEGVNIAYDTFFKRRTLARSQTTDQEINAMLDEIANVSTEQDSSSVEAACRYIIAKDQEHHLLSSRLRGMVLTTWGHALYSLSVALSGKEGLSALDQAIACYNSGIIEFGRDVDPVNWAGCQNNKGSALVSQARRLPGADGLDALNQAIACYDAALLGNRRTAVPRFWVMSLDKKGHALKELAERLPGEAGMAALDQAIACCDTALLEKPRNLSPLDWAGVLTTKGTILLERARRLPGEAGMAALDQAIACCDTALLEKPRNLSPLDWALTQNNKGAVLAEKANRLAGTEGLAIFDQAIACFESALLEYHQGSHPIDWAQTQNNKGNALQERAERLGDAAQLEALDQSVTCYDAALLVLSRDTAPIPWAMTQNNKGNVLLKIADLVHKPNKSALLDEAIACFESALLEYRKEVDTLDWAMTQHNKGNALVRRAVLMEGIERLAALDNAIACYDAALLERRRDVVPYYWAMTKLSIGNALQTKAAFVEGVEQLSALEAATKAFQNALEEYTSEISPGLHRSVASMLVELLLKRAFAPQCVSEQREQLLRQAQVIITSAVAAARDLALREPLLPFRQQEWAANARVFTLAAASAATQGHLGEAIQHLEEGRARGLAEAASRRETNLRHLSNEDRHAYQKAVEAVQQIEAESRTVGNVVALRERAHEAQLRLKQIAQDLQRKHPGFFPEPDVTLAKIVRGLMTGEALVYLIPSAVGTLLLATTAAGMPVMRWLGDLTSDAIHDLAVQRDAQGWNRLGYLPAALGFPNTTSLDEALDALLPKLGDQLMRWVVADVHALGCHRAVLVAGGFLSVMPLHAATYLPLSSEPPTAPNGRRYACDDIAFTYAPSGLTLRSARANAKQQARMGPAQRMFVAGNPQLTDQGTAWELGDPNSHGYLPFAEWEAQRVNELVAERRDPGEVTLAIGAEATWSAVIHGLNTSDLAHLALHACFDPDHPEESALRVAFDAYLFLRDLLDSKTVSLDRLRLIVLSACESGQSDVLRNSEEAIGLFGALLAAGAPAVIGTLWPVNDLVTARLMESFARRAYRDGVASDAALRAAARELRGIPDAHAAPAESGAMPATQARVLLDAAAEAVVLAQDTRDMPVLDGAGSEHGHNERDNGIWAQGDTQHASGIYGENDAPMMISQATPARIGIAEMSAQTPELVGVRRLLTPEQWSETNQLVTGDQMGLRRGPEHPMYWAAFVYYGASVSLFGHVDTQASDENHAQVLTSSLKNDENVSSGNDHLPPDIPISISIDPSRGPFTNEGGLTTMADDQSQRVGHPGRPADDSEQTSDAPMPKTPLQKNEPQRTEPSTQDGSRTNSYFSRFPKNPEACPRCGGKSFIGVPDPDGNGRTMRQCQSCYLVYPYDGATGGGAS